jgi:signal transduction histidine kinase
MIKNDLWGAWFIGQKKTKNIFSREEMKFLYGALYLLCSRMENMLLYEQLVAAERFTMLGQMAAMVAHEIRNPLTGLSSFIQMMNERRENREKIMDKFLKIAPAEFKRLEKLTENLLALSHATRLEIKPVSLAALSKEIIEFLNHIFKKNSVEVFEEYADLPDIMCDREQIRQAILNLVINSVQAMPEGGKITIRTGRKNVSEKEYFFLSVKDSGAGVNDAVKEKIFDAFFTTKEAGSGLGLTISGNIMKSHGGMILTESSEGRGSEFILCFPADIGYNKS